MQFLKRKFGKTYNLYRTGLQYCIRKASYLQKNTAITSFQTDVSYRDIFQVLMYAIKSFIQKISWLEIFFISRDWLSTLDNNLTVRCISNVIRSKNPQILLLNQISSQNSDDNGFFVPLRFDPLKVMTVIMKSDPAGSRVCVNISNTGGPLFTGHSTLHYHVFI